MYGFTNYNIGLPIRATIVYSRLKVYGRDYAGKISLFIKVEHVKNTHLFLYVIAD